MSSGRSTGEGHHPVGKLVGRKTPVSPADHSPCLLRPFQRKRVERLAARISISLTPGASIGLDIASSWIGGLCEEWAGVFAFLTERVLVHLANGGVSSNGA